MGKWYWLNTSYACAGVAIDTETGLVIEAAPIFRRMKGKPFLAMLAELKRREQLLEVYPMYDKDGNKSKRVHLH